MRQREVLVRIPKPDFTLFNARRDELPEVIVVNGALKDFEQKEVFPWYLRISIDAKELIENGMPAPEENELLFEIGDEIERVVLGGRTKNNGENALFIARGTWNGLRELRYQIHDPEIANDSLQSLLQSRDWPRPWEFEMKCQPDWKNAGYAFRLFTLAARGDA
jgi:hypothetical protein